MLYFLGDEIYPSWPLLAKPIHKPVDEAERTYNARQEAVRKDIESFFGVLQSRFEILRREKRRWDVQDIVRISETAVLCHSILVSFVEADDFDVEYVVDIVQKFYEEDSVEGDRVRKLRREVMQYRTIGMTLRVKGTLNRFKNTWLTL